MITQKEVQIYMALAEQLKAYEEAFKATRENLIARVGTHEAVEPGGLSLALKSFEKASVKYKEVVEDVAEAHPAIASFIDEAILTHTTKAMQHRLDAVKAINVLADVEKVAA